MEPIKVSIEVNVNLSQSTKDFLAKLNFGATNPVAPVISVPTTPVKPAESASAKPAESVQTKPAEVPATVKTNITLEDLRIVAAQKLNAHREDVKNKLTELGTPSLTKLDANRYQEMLDFLNSLD